MGNKNVKHQDTFFGAKVVIFCIRVGKMEFANYLHFHSGVKTGFSNCLRKCDI